MLTGPLLLLANSLLLTLRLSGGNSFPRPLSAAEERDCLARWEAEIVRLRFGLGGTLPLTQREIASSFGISRSYVSRRH